MEYFTLDVFHSLDMFSYVVSLISMIFFMMWLGNQMSLKKKSEGDYSEFLSFLEDLNSQRHLYQVISACNLLTICVRPLKFFRNDPRMSKLNTTFSNATVDVLWFNVMLIFFFVGFVLFAHITFGVQIESLSSIPQSMVFLFEILIGAFDFWELYRASPVFAIMFVFGFLFLFKFFFLNIFFAILDKNFVTGEAPPVNIYRTLKPVFGRLFRWIDWDQDLTMHGDAEKNKADAPPSRAGRIHKVAMQIQDARSVAELKEDGGSVKKSKALNDVCEADERMNEVLRWSREEAKKFSEQYRRLYSQKMRANNDEVFIKQKVKDDMISKELVESQDAMHEAERLHRYAILVNERLAMRDQDILAKYILRLERKIGEKMKEYHALNTDVHHLSAEAAKMAFDAAQLEQIDQHEVEEDHGADAADAAGTTLAIAEGRQATEEEPEEEEEDELKDAPAPGTASADKGESGEGGATKSKPSNKALLSSLQGFADHAE
jgi:hypothetical protein